MFKVVIIGGEYCGSYDLFCRKCVQYLRNQTKNGIMILTTGDKYVDAFAQRCGLPTQRFNADFNRYGKNALKKRDESLLHECNGLIYFNCGLKDFEILTETARRGNIPVRVVNPSQK